MVLVQVLGDRKGEEQGSRRGLRAILPPHPANCQNTASESSISGHEPEMVAADKGLYSSSHVSAAIVLTQLELLVLPIIPIAEVGRHGRAAMEVHEFVRAK
jgi:hypothetical protein